MLTSELWFFLEIPIIGIFQILPLNAQQGVLYIEPVVTNIYYFRPSVPLFGVGVLADHLLVVSCSATTTYLC